MIMVTRQDCSCECILLAFGEITDVADDWHYDRCPTNHFVATDGP